MLPCVLPLLRAAVTCRELFFFAYPWYSFQMFAVLLLNGCCLASPTQTTHAPIIRVDRNARLAVMLIHGCKLVFLPLFKEDMAVDGEEASIR